MRKFRVKIKRKFLEKTKRKFREKNINHAKKKQKFCETYILHSLTVMVERMYCGRTDRNLKR